MPIGKTSPLLGSTLRITFEEIHFQMSIMTNAVRKLENVGSRRAIEEGITDELGSLS